MSCLEGVQCLAKTYLVCLSRMFSARRVASISLRDLCLGFAVNASFMCQKGLPNRAGSMEALLQILVSFLFAAHGHAIALKKKVTPDHMAQIMMSHGPEHVKVRYEWITTWTRIPKTYYMQARG